MYRLTPWERESDPELASPQLEGLITIFMGLSLPSVSCLSLHHMAVPQACIVCPCPWTRHLICRTKISPSVQSVPLPLLGHLFSLVSVPYLPKTRGVSLRFYVLCKWEQIFWQWIRSNKRSQYCIHSFIILLWILFKIRRLWQTIFSWQSILFLFFNWIVLCNHIP